MSAINPPSPVPVAQSPEFIPLPACARGKDSVFNLSRSFWFRAEKKGLIQFVRLRMPGCQRGRVLIPVDKARAMIRDLGEKSAAA
jgi:hypothetical protein